MYLDSGFNIMQPSLVTRKFSGLLHPSNPGVRATPKLRALLAVVIFLAMCSTIASTVYTYFAKQLKHVIDFNFYGIRCDRCQYLDCNPHLKCAVHPSTVLTRQAVNCKDYQQNISENTLKPKIFKNVV